jgi:Zn-dependent protease with chaperone function
MFRFRVRLSHTATSIFLGVVVVCTANFSSASEFSDEFIRLTQQLSNEKIPRPLIRSDEQGRDLTQNIHFKIFDITKKICEEEGIKVDTCKWNIRVDRGPAFNAYATKSNQIVIYSGLIDNITYEDELAFVVAHEIAHHLLNHIKTKRNVIFSGLILGELVFGDVTGGLILSSIVNQVTSREFESSADKIALRIISLAGYDTSKAKFVLMRMAKMTPKLTSRFMQSHPSGIERLVAFEKMASNL